VIAVAVVVGRGYAVQVAVDVPTWFRVSFFLVATPSGVGMVGFFKQRAKALSSSLLPAPTVLPLSECHFPIEGTVVLLLL
jgi:hypothetical protein